MDYLLMSNIKDAKVLKLEHDLEKLTVGCADADLTINSIDIDVKHAFFQKELVGGSWYVKNTCKLPGKTGVFVNNVKLDRGKRQLLKEGDMINFGYLRTGHKYWFQNQVVNAVSLRNSAKEFMRMFSDLQEDVLELRQTCQQLQLGNAQLLQKNEVQVIDPQLQNNERQANSVKLQQTSQQDNTTQSQENNQLQEKNQQLQAKNQQLQAKIQQLRLKSQQLQVNNQKFLAQKQQLQAVNQHQQTQNQKLQETIQQLQAKNEELQANIMQNNQQLQKNAIQFENNQQLQQTHQQLQANNQQLQAQNLQQQIHVQNLLGKIQPWTNHYIVVRPRFSNC